MRLAAKGDSMKRLSIVCVLMVAAFVVCAANPAGAAPSNKNSGQATLSCDNGQSLEITFIQHTNETADVTSAAPIVGGGGAVKLLSITAFAPGTTNELFTATTNFGGPETTTCHGTATEFGMTFDLTAHVFIAGR